MIPVIDLGPYLAACPHAAAATAAELGRALQDVGFFFGTVLRLPPEQLARLHILPQSQIDAWLAAGHFHTVTIGTTEFSTGAGGPPEDWLGGSFEARSGQTGRGHHPDS